MGKDHQELNFRHVCKFCNKSFPCGRSLGGHMRSHVINSAETGDDHKMNRKKQLSLSKKISNCEHKNVGSHVEDRAAGASAQIAYGLRENPKKSSRLTSSNEDTLLDHDKLCKECGKGFPSWKALFGHMKCHSEKVSTSVEEDSWNSSNNHKVLMDSQSDNDTAAPNRRKRSRRMKRYNMAVAASSSMTNIAASYASPSISEIELEQEEVAMSLILLSRDVGNWPAGLNSAGESSDNNFEFLEVKSSSQTIQVTNGDGKNTKSHKGAEFVKFKKLKNGKLVSTLSDKNSTGNNTHKSSTHFVPRNGSLDDSRSKKVKLDNGFRKPEFEQPKSLVKEHSRSDQFDLDSDKETASKKLSHGGEASATEFSIKFVSDSPDTYEMYQQCSDKKSSFECTTCNKSFHSYQALGGHRASHKKIKSCYPSKIESSENSIEAEVSPNQTADSKTVKCYSSDNMIEKTNADFGSSKSNKGHECPICFKVFPSGQALGGHKRSHLIAEAKSNQNIGMKKPPIPEIRDFLDLNLPAPVEEENCENVDAYKPWWVGSISNHEREPLLGLLSN